MTELYVVCMMRRVGGPSLSQFETAVQPSSTFFYHIENLMADSIEHAFSEANNLWVDGVEGEICIAATRQAALVIS